MIKTIIWFVSSPISIISKIVGQKYEGNSGTWIEVEYSKVKQSGDKIIFVFPNNSTKSNFNYFENDYGIAYSVPLKKPSYGIKHNYFKVFKKIIESVKPDIIHIWGTESSFCHSASLLKGNFKKILTLQGILGFHQRYKRSLLKNLPGNKFLLDFWIYFLKEIIKFHLFKIQVKFECEIINNVDFILNDNNYGDSYIQSVSPKPIIYYPILPNKLFSEVRWNVLKCEKDSIFTTYSYDYEKGLFELLKALIIVKKSIPSVKLYVPGKKRKNFFWSQINRFICKNKLSANLVYLGKLSPLEMRSNLLKANIFVSSSIMENHNLALREALFVGTPSIATLTGSNLEFIKENINGHIYRFEDYEYLAFLIINLLKSKEKQISFSNYCFDFIEKEHKYNLTDFYQNL